MEIQSPMSYNRKKLIKFYWLKSSAHKWFHTQQIILLAVNSITRIALCCALGWFIECIYIYIYHYFYILLYYIYIYIYQSVLLFISLWDQAISNYKITIMGVGQLLRSTFYRFVYLWFHVNLTTIPEIHLFQNCTLKIHGQGQWWGQRSRSHSGSDIISTHAALFHVKLSIHS